ncbi:hypothetical protein BGZ83_011643 [Gryganskiella cystojenkinii]|nr:hypothetical protein BGZ83_011643 [Gryganskiella cystojenkinii]
MACPAGYTYNDPTSTAPYVHMSNNLHSGQRIRIWGLNVVWSENHVRAGDLEPFRVKGDPLADDALETLGIKRGQDSYSALTNHAQWVNESSGSDAPCKLLDQLMTVPDWVDWDKIQRGQQVFLKYVLYISIGLIHYSITGGFNAPKLVKTILSTGYLTGSSSKRRVLETSQFVLDVMRSVDGLKPGTGDAWKSIIRVRFMHAQVRRKLLKIAQTHHNYYSVKEHGVPINQEDMAATIFSFSSAMWRFMEDRLGIQMALNDREDYLHVWRLVGYYLGVDPTWDPARDTATSDVLLDLIMMHLMDPNEMGGKLTSNLLLSMSEGLWMTHTNPLYRFNTAVAETLIGSDTWILMGMSPVSWFYRILREVLFAFLYLDLWLRPNGQGQRFDSS